MSKLAVSPLVTFAGVALLLQGCAGSGGFQDGGPGLDGGTGGDAGFDAGTDAGFDAGSLQFGTPIFSAVPFGAAELAAADFNGDGKLDLIVSLGFPDSDAGSVELLLGNGDGTFQSPLDYPAGGAPRGIVVADLDGDGRSDFAVGVCADGGSFVSVFLNGDGGFAPRVDVAVSSCPLSLAAADLDGDGLPDLATAGPGLLFNAGADGGLGEIHLLLNQGAGSFAVSKTLTTDSPASGLAAADLDGDSLPDLEVTTIGVSSDGGPEAVLLVWLGNDGGALMPLLPTILDHGGYGALAAGDLDGDGHQDLALVSRDSDTLALLLGNGDGTFRSPTYQAASGAPVAVALGDLGKKGALDVASSTSEAYFQGLSIFPGGGLAPAPAIGGEERLLSDGASYGLAIADFTGDGRPDIAVSLTYRSAVAVLPGLAKPPALPDPSTFATATHLPIPSVPNQGGPTIENPKMITLTFQDDPNTPFVQLYADWIVSSEWMSTIGQPYGVRVGTNTNIVIPQDAPPVIADSEIQKLVSDLIQDGGAPPPIVPDGGRVAQEIYFVYFPRGTSITAGPTTSCVEFGAYHAENALGPVHFAYAAIPTCDPNNQYYSQMIAVSHELAEASTNPLVDTEPAYTSGLSFNGGLSGEVADVCAAFEGARYQLEGGTLVEAPRIWSNPAASGSTQPCIPAPRGVYANVSPSQAGSAGNIFSIAPGGSLDIALTGWTTAPSVPFGVYPLPRAKFGSLIPLNLVPEIRLSKPNLANGEQATLTVTVPMDAGAQSLGMITLLTGFDEQNYGYWPLIIYVP